MLSTSDTSSSPHLVFVTTKPFFSNAGGGEKVLCAMASEFVNRGFKCTILCCDVQSTGKPFFPLDSRVQIINSFKGIPLFARQTFRNLRCLFLPELAKFDKRKKLNPNGEPKLLNQLSKIYILPCIFVKLLTPPIY